MATGRLNFTFAWKVCATLSYIFTQSVMAHGLLNVCESNVTWRSCRNEGQGFMSRDSSQREEDVLHQSLPVDLKASSHVYTSEDHQAPFHQVMLTALFDLILSVHHILCWGLEVKMQPVFSVDECMQRSWDLTVCKCVYCAAKPPAGSGNVFHAANSPSIIFHLPPHLRSGIQLTDKDKDSFELEQYSCQIPPWHTHAHTHSTSTPTGPCAL